MCASVTSILLYYLILFVNTAYSNEYCKIKCNVTGVKHAVCRGRGYCQSSNCEVITQTYIWRQDMMKRHNFYRNNVALGNESRGDNRIASNMMALSYDLELELIAECWIIGYVYDYDPCAKNLKGEPIGQNIFKGIYQPENIDYIVASWYRQVTNHHITRELTMNFTAHDGMYRRYRHFTQLVNAETRKLGCAACVDLTDTNMIVMCNYWPAGNREGRSVYESGPPASQCPPGVQRSSVYMGLCGEEVLPLRTRRLGIIRGGAREGALATPVALLLLLILAGCAR